MIELTSKVLLPTTYLERILLNLCISIHLSHFAFAPFLSIVSVFSFNSPSYFLAKGCGYVNSRFFLYSLSFQSKLSKKVAAYRWSF